MRRRVTRVLLPLVWLAACSPVTWMGYPRFDPDEPRDPPPPEPVAIEVERTRLETYAGAYRMRDGVLRVELRDSGLAYATGEPAEWIPLLAETPERFFVEYEDARFVFVTDEAGNVLRLDVLDGDEVYPLPRIEE